MVWGNFEVSTRTPRPQLRPIRGLIASHGRPCFAHGSLGAACSRPKLVVADQSVAPGSPDWLQLAGVATMRVYVLVTVAQTDIVCSCAMMSLSPTLDACATYKG